MFYKTEDNIDRAYIGQIIEVPKRGGVVSNLLSKINFRHKGIKIDNRWYSLERINGEIYDQDIELNEPYVIYTKNA